MSINRVVLSGNLTRDAEIRMSQSGMAIVSFGVAVNDRRKNQQTGEWEDYANFVDCAMFGTRAEKLQPYLEKGTKVAIEGKLRWSQWEHEGQKRSKLEVIVDEIELMSRGAARGQVSNQPISNYGETQNQAPDAFSQAQERARQAVLGGIQGQVLEPSAPAIGSPEYMQSVYDQDIPF